MLQISVPSEESIPEAHTNPSSASSTRPALQSSRRSVQRRQLFADRGDLRLGVGLLGALLVDHRCGSRLHETLVRELALDALQEPLVIGQLFAQLGDLGFAVDPIAQRHEILRGLHDEGRGRGIVLNVCDAEASKKAVDDIVAEYGRIDVLINNAGITKDGLVMRMKDEQWETVIETDLTAAFRLARACVRPMMKQRSGRIISMSSVVGAMGNAGQVNYAAAKAGLVGMTMSLAREIGSRGITVNCIAPGFIDTDMTKDLPEEHKTALIGQTALGRLGQTDDVANACLYLASPAGAYVTGIVLHVNGGMYMG